jgi:hypothetical protein
MRYFHTGFAQKFRAPPVSPPHPDRVTAQGPRVMKHNLTNKKPVLFQEDRLG